MSGLRGKLALITGASSGIGLACARRLAADGADLVLWARRAERLQALAADLAQAHGGQVDTAVVDVRDRQAVEAAASALVAAGRVPDILVNNAGLAAGLATVQEGDPADWDLMIDTNVKGLLYVSRGILPAMVRRGTGHVVNIGSLAGHQVYPRGNVYNATKFAVHALSQAMNLDVAGTRVKVSSVDPGLVETEFSLVRFGGDAARARKTYEGLQPLAPADVAEVVWFIVSAPEHVNIQDVIMTTTAQRSVHLVDRREPG